MAKDGAARLRLRPVGAADRKKLPEYGPLGTGCPAVERAVAALYKGQNEESFWALMNAINYALELDTRVLVPLEATSDQPDGAAPWAEHPVPAEKAKDLQPWTLRTQKGRCYLPVFTSVKMAEADKGTASRPMAERLLASAMQMALDSDSIDGVVIDPWTSSATLDCSLLNGLLHASHDTDEPGEAELRAGNHAMAEERWDDAMHYYQLSAEEGCAEGLAMMGEMLYEGRGCRKSPAQARKFWRKAADAGDNPVPLMMPMPHPSAASASTGKNASFCSRNSPSPIARRIPSVRRSWNGRSIPAMPRLEKQMSSGSMPASRQMPPIIPERTKVISSNPPGSVSWLLLPPLRKYSLPVPISIKTICVFVAPPSTANTKSPTILRSPPNFISTGRGPVRLRCPYYTKFPPGAIVFRQQFFDFL